MEGAESIYDEAFWCGTVITRGKMSRKIEALDGHHEFHTDIDDYGRASIFEPVLY